MAARAGRGPSHTGGLGPLQAWLSLPLAVPPGSAPGLPMAVLLQCQCIQFVGNGPGALRIPGPGVPDCQCQCQCNGNMNATGSGAGPDCSDCTAATWQLTRRVGDGDSDSESTASGSGTAVYWADQRRAPRCTGEAAAESRGDERTP